MKLNGLFIHVTDVGLIKIGQLSAALGVEIKNFVIYDAMPRSNSDAWIEYTEANDNSTTVQV